ncbi:uncharacterized protein UV8b_07714 [Ustilaginoidea virens]|uniref:Oxidoreductase-like protein n=2 Tax=Ustilaginoidea virens TaxID=1159556 RepID=A0A8E5HXS7_USTVR|nr:uncharacterized protein UV8b_07714 [Ustilaginoidea virens]QUC23473.1 hypothetical protein UV8b_07714 [Ustilaginoidea virens]
MEARSLSALNRLAANPPQYPEKPLNDRKDPLTLYFSRVPGTRDVILSPFRPQEKNVTGQDVNSSLYYAHLMLPEDLAAPGDENTWLSSPESATLPLSIPRKPVPDAARPSTPESLPSPCPQIQHQTPAAPSDPTPSRSNLPVGHDGAPVGNRPRPQTPEALALRTSPVVLDSPLDANEAPERISAGLQTKMPARKPLGPRAMAASAAAHVPGAGSPTDVDQVSFPGNLGMPIGEAVGSNDQIKQMPLASPTRLEGSRTQSIPIRRKPVYQTLSRSPSPRKHSIVSINGTGTPFTLVLIRRDPSSGLQWNVGRVSSRQVDPAEDGSDQAAQTDSTSPPTAMPFPRRHPPIDIELENSGYAKFRFTTVNKSSRTEGSVEKALQSLARDGAKQAVGVFSRQVAMEYSKSFATNVRETMHRIGHASRTRIDRYRSDSVGSTLSNTSDVPETAESIVTSGPPPEGMKARGYTFESPWNDKCEFRTGMAGRSVICRRVRHEAGSSAQNPLASDQGGLPGLRGDSQLVSELRFNLPGADLFSEHAKNSKEQWKGNFGKLFNSVHYGDCDDRDEDEDNGGVSPFKMNLGSEKAGGGNRGKRAKLAKLIIYDDGLQMLDLVVAANIGMWWGAWEKTF